MLGTVSNSAFVQIMTAEKEDDLDDFFEELTGHVEGLDGVSVVGPQGVLARGDLPERFADAVFALEEGAFSGVLKAEYGFHVFTRVIFSCFRLCRSE